MDQEEALAKEAAQGPANHIEGMENIRNLILQAKNEASNNMVKGEATVPAKGEEAIIQEDQDNLLIPNSILRLNI